MNMYNLYTLEQARSIIKKEERTKIKRRRRRLRKKIMIKTLGIVSVIGGFFLMLQEGILINALSICSIILSAFLVEFVLLVLIFGGAILILY